MARGKYIDVVSAPLPSSFFFVRGGAFGSRWMPSQSKITLGLFIDRSDWVCCSVLLFDFLRLLLCRGMGDLDVSASK